MWSAVMMKIRGVNPSTLILLVGILIGWSLTYIFTFLTISTFIKVSVSVSVEESANTTTVLERLNLPSLENLTTTGYVVPNTVHYIWFAENAQKPLSFINYLSALSAYKIHKPTEIKLHCNFLPSGQWWEQLWRDVPITVVFLSPPLNIHGQPLAHNFHKADVAKMEILLREGGIILDMDVLVVNSLDPLRVFDVTLGKEKSAKLIAGIIVAKPKALFIRLLHESYRNNYHSMLWDFNCARVSYEIYRQRPDLVHVELYRLTTPDWQDRHLLFKETINWRDLYVIHVMTHKLKDVFTPDSIGQLKSTFGEVSRYIYFGSSKLIV